MVLLLPQSTRAEIGALISRGWFADHRREGAWTQWREAEELLKKLLKKLTSG
jgi:hypothetical protein